MTRPGRRPARIMSLKTCMTVVNLIAWAKLYSAREPVACLQLLSAPSIPRAL